MIFGEIFTLIGFLEGWNSVKLVSVSFNMGNNRWVASLFTMLFIQLEQGLGTQKAWCWKYNIQGHLIAQKCTLYSDKKSMRGISEITALGQHPVGLTTFSNMFVLDWNVNELEITQFYIQYSWPISHILEHKFYPLAEIYI